MEWILRGKKKPEALKTGHVGIYCTHDEISMAYMTEEDNTPVLSAFEYHTADSASKKEEVLAVFVKKHNLMKTGCTYILKKEEYTLSLVETPNAPPSEIHNAFKWLAQEAVSTPIDKSVVDYFELPLRRARDSVKMSYITIMSRTCIPTIESLIKPSQLILQTIDIPEFCLRNLGDLQPDIKKGVICVVLSAEGGKLVIYKAGMILLCRSIDFKIEGGHTEITADSPVLEQMALEIQRSIDYSSNIFRQTVANTILIMPSMLNTTDVGPYLKTALGLEVEYFDLSSCNIKFSQALTLAEQAHCLMAIGAAVKHVHLALETEH